MVRLPTTTLEAVYERIVARAIEAIPAATSSNCFLGADGDMPDVPDELAFVIVPSPNIQFTDQQEGGGQASAEIATTFTVKIFSTVQHDAIGRTEEMLRNVDRGLWPQLRFVTRAFLDHDLLDASGNEMLSESIHAGSGNLVSFDRSFSPMSVVFEMHFDMDLSSSNLNTESFGFFNFNGNGDDNTGNGQNLTENGSIAYDTGKIGNAAVFSAVTDFYSLGQDFEMKIDEAQSISCWLYCTALNGSPVVNGGVASSTNDDKSGQWLLANYGNGAVVLTHWRNDGTDPDGGLVSESGLITLNTWHHLVITHDNGSYKLYFDNVERTFPDQTIDSASGWGDRGLEVGRAWLGGDFGWKGRIDMFGLWNRALNETEVSELFNDGNGLEAPFT